MAAAGEHLRYSRALPFGRLARSAGRAGPLLDRCRPAPARAVALCPGRLERRIGLRDRCASGTNYRVRLDEHVARLLNDEHNPPVSPQATDTRFSDPAQPRAAVDAHPLWYHTLELAPGLVTRGWFDLRPVVNRLPWPEVRGKRCLEVGPWDGFFSFELERRGAAAVVAVDIGDHQDWDWAPRVRELGVAAMAGMAGPKIDAGFKLAREILGSKVERRVINVYDLSPQSVGTFDVVVCGSLLLHLRDPVRALEAIRSVCHGRFLSTETIKLRLSTRHPRYPVAHFGSGENGQWWIPNVAGYRRMVHAAGFTVERTTKPFSIPLGAAHPARQMAMSRRLRTAPRRLAGRILTRGEDGVHQAALLARP